MKLGSVTKIDKTNRTVSKKIEDDVMSENCVVIVIKVASSPKNADLYKNADISRNKRVLVLKSIFSETTYVCLLEYQI